MAVSLAYVLKMNLSLMLQRLWKPKSPGGRTKLSPRDDPLAEGGTFGIKWVCPLLHLWRTEGTVRVHRVLAATETCRITLTLP